MNFSCFVNTFLNTDEINNIGKSNIFLKKIFLGPYPANMNQLKQNHQKKRKKCGWIWNTDKDHLPGQH